MPYLHIKKEQKNINNFQLQTNYITNLYIFSLYTQTHVHVEFMVIEAIREMALK